MNFLTKQQQGALYAISSGLCYGLVGYFGINVMHTGLSVCTMLFWRFLIATVFMLVILIPYYRTSIRSSRENFKILFYGMAFYSTSAIVYFIASQHMGTGLAMVIFFSFPAVVMVLNFIFYKTRIRAIYLIAFSLIVIGMMCLVDIQNFKYNILGIGLGILSAILYALYIISSKKITLSPMLSTLMVSAGCMITCLAFSWLDSSFNIPNDPKSWIDIIGLALICTVLPILLLLQGLKYISSEKASILSVMEPIAVVITGIILLGETVTNTQYMGIVIILCGALMTLLPYKTQLENI